MRKSKDVPDLSPGTLRQRRNLLTVAIILIVYYLADVRFGEAVRIMGVSAVVHRPEVIPKLMLLALGYLLWRFYKYANSDNAFDNVRRQFRDGIKERLDRQVMQRVSETRDRRQGLQGGVEYRNLVRKSAGEYAVTVYWNPPGGTGEPEEETLGLSVLDLEKERVKSVFGFAFRGRILSDYFVPYALSMYALYLYAITQ